MKKVITLFFVIVTITACKKPQNDLNIPVQDQQENLLNKPVPPVNANPAFAFKSFFSVGQRVIPGIYVMDVNGANKTKVYSNYNSQYMQWVEYPAWNESGTKLCFTSDFADLYTLNISLANGVPTGSGATKIADGIAAGGQYKQGKWRPGESQIACLWKKTGDADKIHLVPSAGGSPTVLYTAANTDWVIEDDIAFNPDGSRLLFSERQVSTGFIYLKVFDMNLNVVINSIDMSQFKFIKELDWGRTAGTNTIAIITVPKCDNTYIGSQGINQLYTLDVSSSTPSLSWRKDDLGNTISWSPDDLRINVAPYTSASYCNTTTGCCNREYNQSFRILTLSTSAFNTWFSNFQVIHPDWKR
jgi:Tol biopolymer transport system component